jgi:hypothetical protein
VLAPDADGYYEIIVGGLNVFNSVNQFYTLQGAQNLFESSSDFMRRVKNGCLKAETGHPKKGIGQSDRDYFNRVMTIREDNVCAHLADVWLDVNFGKNHPEYKNPNLVAIMAKVKPAGPHAAAMQEAFSNPKQNVCFSIRSITRDYYDKGVYTREVEEIITFDWVTEPGIHIANKWDSPATEALAIEGLGGEADIRLTKNMVKDVLFKSMSMGMGVEDSKALVQQTLNIIEKYETKPTVSLNISKW